MIARPSPGGVASHQWPSRCPMSPWVRRYAWANLLAVIVLTGVAIGSASSRRSSVWSALFPSSLLLAVSFGLLLWPLLSGTRPRFTLRAAAFAITGIGILLADFVHELSRGVTV